MPEFFKNFLTAGGFIPHGHCYLWKPGLVWLHVASDSLIALAYYSIPVMLLYFVRSRRDVPFDWMFLMFGTFIVACGTTHLLEVWTLWHPTYWLSGFVKAITALVSLCTAVLLVPLIPKALALPSPAQLEAANLALRNEITQRQLAEEALQKANEQLEFRVQERTAELALINESLQAEIESHKRTEEALNRREQEFKALVENAPDIITRFDRDLRHVYVNPAVELVTGLLPKAFIGKTNRELGMPEELVSLWENVIRKVLETGQQEVIEFQFPTPSSLKYYQARLVPELAKDGAIESTLCITRDITERKLVEEALLRRTRQLEILSRASLQINSVLEIPAIMRTLIASGMELVGTTSGTYGLMSQGKMFFPEYNENGSIRPIDVTLERGIGVAGWVMETRFPYVANDAENDPHVLPHLQKAFGFYNLVNIPIFNRTGELIGCFDLHNKADRRPFSENDITMLQGLAASAAVALENAQMLVERKQVEEALRTSEQRFRATFNQAAVGIAQVGIDGQWLLVNQKLCDIVGYTREELLELSFQDITHPDDLAPDLEYVGRIMTGEISTYSMEKRYIRKDGSQVWINLTVSLVRNSSSEPKYFIGIVEDISDRKQTEEELRKSLKDLSDIKFALDQAAIVAITDARGIITYINDKFCEISQYSREELIGQSHRIINSGYHPKEFFQDLWSTISAGKVWQGEIKNGAKDGTYYWVDTAIVPFLNDQGKPFQYLAIRFDITDRKRAEQEIRELNSHLERRVAERTAELEAANKELEAFSYSVSHDLRAPLRGIDGFSKAILDRYTDKLDDKGQHYLQRIRAGTQRMGELIDDLLKLSRVTRSEMRRTKVDLSAMAKESAAELYSTQPERQVEWAIAPGLVADGDSRLLRIVLENLLNNSWKFTSLRIHSRIEFNAILQEDGKLAYFVRDNGAGFDMVYANKLFGAFVRLHSTTQFPGTGIGLATVQRIIHRHGGRVWAQGAVEQGATFYFTL